MSSPRSGPRLVAFDLDGTLLGHDLLLGERILQAVRELCRKGLEVVVVTGRMRGTAEAYALQMGLGGSPVVFFNGAAAKEAGGEGLWWHETLESARAAEVITFLAGKGLEPLMFCGDRLLAGDPDPDRLAIYRAISQVEPEITGDLMAQLTGPNSLSPTKMIQVEDPERMPALYGEAKELFGWDLNVTTSYPFFLEILSRRARKDLGLERVCRKLGVRREEVAAFGDGMNDLEMISWAGIGVAMASGPPALREAADHVVEGPPGEGVARFLEREFL